MRDHLLLYINGRRQLVTGDDCFLSLSDYLRQRLGLVGTKIVCSEGDCGSCSVLVGRPAGDRFDYRPVDSCIQWMFQLDGTHIISVEGLAGCLPAARRTVAGGEGESCLTPVQQAMVACHGSQCGFCTPGFAVAMTGLLEHDSRLAVDDWRSGLTGNLCRCTGYVPIIDAGMSLDADALKPLNDIYRPTAMLQELAASAADSIAVLSERSGRMRRFFSPTSLAEALDIRAASPDAKVVAGATDVGVQLNKGIIDPDEFLDLNRVAELSNCDIQSNGDGEVLVAGARASWTQIGAICESSAPEFHKIVSIFGSPQIRHVGTIGGNVINASPIADSLPFLMVTESELELASSTGTRNVPITSFYKGYKKFDLGRDELLTQIRIPLPLPSIVMRLIKVSRRRDLDIATFTAAIWMELDGDAIGEARIAFGAVGPTVLRARHTEDFLRGKAFDESTMRDAGDVALSEITPIDDVRGSANYRRQLTRNALLKFYHEYALATV